MSLIIKGKKYTIPGEGNEKAATGKEIVEIENYFNLDGLVLFQSMIMDKPPAGYSKTKAMYATAWMALTRAGEIVSIDDVLNDYSIDDFDFEADGDDDPKKDQPDDSVMEELQTS